MIIIFMGSRTTIKSTTFPHQVRTQISLVYTENTERTKGMRKGGIKFNDKGMGPGTVYEPAKPTLLHIQGQPGL